MATIGRAVPIGKTRRSSRIFRDMGMKVLLVGSGGREHALAWRLAASPLLERLWIAPGNPGCAAHGETVPIAADDVAGLTAFAVRNGVDLCVPGPEAPLVAGLADALSERGIPTFGPSAAAAELEGSKAWCKELLAQHRIPTAAHRTFSRLSQAVGYLEHGASFPCVVKASGLAAGKGVVICPDLPSAIEATQAMLEGGRFGEAGTTVVIEEFLHGPEASFFCITDGRTLEMLEHCMDHKALCDGGVGPNTGGMGAISPNPAVSERTRRLVERHVLLPTVHAMNREGRPFRGVLFAGLKLTTGGPKVLEYNVRFGDPECQTLMPRLCSDLLPHLHAAAVGSLDEQEPLVWDERPACTVVLAAAGYPESPRRGDPVSGLAEAEALEDVHVFHAGTRLDEEGRLVTAGGRVLAVTALGADAAAARNRAYEAVSRIRFEGMQYRTDIGIAAVEGAVRHA